MDELEKILEFVDTEISLVEGLKQISRIESENLVDLNDRFHEVLSKLKK